MLLETVLRRLYDSEINITIRSMWDAGWEFAFISPMEDPASAKWFSARSSSELAATIHRAAIEAQQGTEYVRRYA